jgi:hypothetical protein
MFKRKQNPQDPSNSKGVNRRQFLVRSAIGAGAVALTAAAQGCGGSGSSAFPVAAATTAPWKFGVMADTQWTTPPGDDGFDPNSSAVSIATQIQQQFINSGVKFVVHVGDLCDNGAIAGEDTRALYVQNLYNAGIGFFPLRGNHDDGAANAAEFARLYPQTGAVAANAGTHNATPSDILSTFAQGDPQVTADAARLPFAANTGSKFACGSNFSSPNPYGNGNLQGLSYSFDYNGARFILLDQFTPPTLAALPSQPYVAQTTFNADGSMAQLGTIALQQPWISQQLTGRPAGSHAFVFAHKGLLTCNHADGLFGNDPSLDPASQDAFIKAMAASNAGYYINGHDHMYDRSLVSTTDGTSARVMQILCASDSAKFYVPAGSGNNTATNGNLSNDLFYDVKKAGKAARRTPITQELYTVGYYIFTIDGPNVTVEYYAADVYPYQSSTSELIVRTAPGLNFTRREVFGYSLVGKQFVVPQGSPYTVVQDVSSTGTVAKVLGGTHAAGAADANSVACTKVVATGWDSGSAPLSSDILALWGINSYVGSSQPDSYSLSLASKATVKSNYYLAALDPYGNWVNAVSLNTGGAPTFVSGPWSPTYALGTYGVDPASNSVWAVLNFNGKFAIANT